MSTEVFDRAKTREVFIWATPKIDLLIAMGSKIGLPLLTFIIPLEEDRFLQDFYLIQEHETIKYDQIIAWFVTELAKINTDRTIALANIATKRIEKNLEFEARDRKLDNKIFSNVVAAALMDAQFDALREDQARLLTRQQQVSTALIKAAAEIEEIQSKILMEAGNLLLAEIDVLKAQQDLIRKDIDILNAQLRVIQIELNVTEVLLDVTNLTLEPMNIRSDIKMMDADIKKTGLSLKHKTAEKEEIRIELDRITRTLIADLNAVYDKENYIIQDKADINTYIPYLALLLVAQQASETARLTNAGYDKTNSVANAQTKISGIDSPEATLRTSNAAVKSATSGQIATKETEVNTARVEASQTENNAQLNAATTRAKADVASTLIHQIGGIE